MHTVTHPGPVRDTRMDLAPCDGRPIDVTLAAGIPLEDAIAHALAPLELDSAWLEIVNADVEKLSYVIPAETPDGAHVAWYSDKHDFTKGQINHLGMIVGRHGDASFLHGHGTWTPQGGPAAAGHILAPHTYLAAPTTVRGIGLVAVTTKRRILICSTPIRLARLAASMRLCVCCPIRISPQDWITPVTRLAGPRPACTGSAA